LRDAADAADACSDSVVPSLWQDEAQATTQIMDEDA